MIKVKIRSKIMSWQKMNHSLSLLDFHMWSSLGALFIYSTNSNYLLCVRYCCQQWGYAVDATETVPENLDADAGDGEMLPKCLS